MSLTFSETPEIRDLLIVFTDVEGFSGIARSLHDDLAILNLMNQLSSVIARHCQEQGGCYIKSMGDGSLAVFDQAEADTGLRAVLAAKAEVEALLRRMGLSNRLRVTAHCGPAAVALCPPHGLPDVFGESVNRASTVGSGSYRGELVITPEAFRKLLPETRRLFRRHIRETVYRLASD